MDEIVSKFMKMGREEKEAFLNEVAAGAHKASFSVLLFSPAELKELMALNYPFESSKRATEINERGLERALKMQDIFHNF